MDPREINYMKRKIFLPLIVVSLISLFAFLFFCCHPRDQTIAIPIDHTLIETLPHDTSFYTQGLTFYKSELYEGTGDPGDNGKSRLMKIDLRTGKVLKAI